jgi:hypothetical protein
MFGRRRRSRSAKSKAVRNRVARSECLEPRVLMAAHTVAATPPTIAQSIHVGAGSTVSGTTATLSALGNDAQGAAGLVYDWTVTSAPAGGSAKFSANGTNAAHNTTLTFTKAGTYDVSVKIVDSHGLSVTNSLAITVAPTLTSIKVTTTSGSAVLGTSSTLQVSGTNQALTAQGFDQFGNALATQPTFHWSTSTAPSGAASPSISASGKNATYTFGKVGAYTVAVQATSSGGASISDKVAINVSPTATSLSKPSTTSFNVTGTSLNLTAPTVLDQFGAALGTQPGITWSTTTLPSGASAPTFANANGATTVTFSSAGSYVLTAKVTGATNISVNFTANVAQTATSIVVTPNSPSVAAGATQQFAAQERDQFGHAMSSQPAFTWSASGGTISTAGLFTAPSSSGSDTISAKSGSLTGTTTISVQAGAGNLAQLVQTLDADGSISRNDMLQILDLAVTNGAVTSAELTELKSIVSQAGSLNMPSYVQQLASDVINGNTANATYQGKSLGNLAVGSSAAQLTDLIDKWFLGSDLPTLTDSSFVYKVASGSLFPTTPSHANEFQGELGDCYFISSLGTIADKNPSAIEDMFINNGDGTYTVRFYAGTYGYTYNASNGSYSDGFQNGTGTAQYVTVNLDLPTTTSGMLVYSDYGSMYNNSNNTLWIALAEKAYAEWNQTGAEGRDGTNTYNGIQGGWMATVDAQVLGHNATDYYMNTATQQELVSALQSGLSVTIGTINDEYGLYGSHAYAVTAYNASTNTFTLYNPWGFDQPGQLTWSQLVSDTTGFVTMNTSGATAISGAVAHPGSIGYFASEAVSSALNDTSASQTSVAAAASWSTSNGGVASSGADDSAQDPISSARTTDSAKSVTSNVNSSAWSSLPSADDSSGDDSSFDSGATSPLAKPAAVGSSGAGANQNVALADLFYAQLGSGSDAIGSGIRLVVAG